MLPRQAKLLRQANQVRRLVWASAPFGVRLAAVLHRLSLDSASAFGSAVYTIFMQAGADDDMDLIDGMRPSEWIKQRRGRQCPPSYRQAKDFGRRAYATALRVARGNRSAAEDALMNAMVKVMKSHDHFLKIPVLKTSENYVLKIIENEVKMAQRGDKHLDIGTPGQEERDEHNMTMTQLNPPDPEDFGETVEWLEKLERLKTYQGPILSDLAKVHPSAPEYLKALIADPHATDVEILGDPKTGKPAQWAYFQEHITSPQFLSQKVKPRLRQVLQKYVNKVENDRA